MTQYEKDKLFTEAQEAINRVPYPERGKLSDSYHSFDELYNHRIILYIALCKELEDEGRIVWRSKKHSDGSEWDGWFILGIHKGLGNQITYHLPISEWNNTEFAQTYKQAPEYDNHTSEDVLKRLKEL